jgi:hypothetical protein
MGPMALLLRFHFHGGHVGLLAVVGVIVLVVVVFLLAKSKP